MLEEEAERILTSIYERLPDEDKCGFKVHVPHRAILSDNAILLSLSDIHYPRIYMEEKQDSVGDAVIRGLEKIGYKVRKNPSGDGIYFPAGTGTFILFEPKKD